MVIHSIDLGSQRFTQVCRNFLGDWRWKWQGFVLESIYTPGFHLPPSFSQRRETPIQTYSRDTVAQETFACMRKRYVTSRTHIQLAVLDGHRENGKSYGKSRLDKIK